jgi:plastocyanin
MTRICLALAAATVALVVAASAYPAAAPRLNGSVGPGFVISLKKAGTKVTTLKHGQYSIVVADRSAIHNFHLKGPGINRNLTAVGFVGTTKPITLTLRAGKYSFYCVPHQLDMHGSFRVT